MSFWYFAFFMLVAVPLIIMWIGCMIDVVMRPDVRGIQKVLWALGMLVLPIIGCAAYLITRPKEIVAMETVYDDTYVGPGGEIPTTSSAGADVLRDSMY